MKKKVSPFERLLSNLLSWGVAYVILRWAFGVGHWAAPISYLYAGLAVQGYYIERALGTRN